MKEWKFNNNLEVYENEYDCDLHCFVVYNGDSYLGTIYPNSIDDMNECISKLDSGIDPITDGWEDGRRNPCRLEGWFEHLFVSVRGTGDKIEEVYDFEEGMKMISKYENEDKKDGNYTEDYYDLVDQDNMSFLPKGYCFDMN